MSVEPHKPTPQQRRNALLSAAVLAAMVCGIYAVFLLKVFSL
jgi:hypothetical protein